MVNARLGSEPAPAILILELFDILISLSLAITLMPLRQSNALPVLRRILVPGQNVMA